jgi:hypothetical protein
MKAIFKQDLCKTYIDDPLCSESATSPVSGVMKQGLVSVLQEYLTYFSSFSAILSDELTAAEKMALEY